MTVAKYVRVVGCLLVVVLTSCPARTQGPQSTEAKVKTRVLCKLKLGAIFRTSERENRDGFLKDCKLELKQVTDALDQCTLTVLEKVLHDAKSETYPKLELAIKGKRRFVLKDANKNDVFLDASTIKLNRNHTVTAGNAPARFTFLVGFEIKGRHRAKFLGLVDAEHTFTWGFISPMYGYDSDGHAFDPRKVNDP